MGSPQEAALLLQHLQGLKRTEAYFELKRNACKSPLRSSVISLKMPPYISSCLQYLNLTSSSSGSM